MDRGDNKNDIFDKSGKLTRCEHNITYLFHIYFMLWSSIYTWNIMQQTIHQLQTHNI